MTSHEKSRVFDPALAALIGIAKPATPIKGTKREANGTPGGQPEPAKKPRTPKKALGGEEGTGEQPPAAPTTPATPTGNINDKKLDLLNMLKSLKKPGVAAGGGAGSIAIDDDDEDEVSQDVDV